MKPVQRSISIRSARIFEKTFIQIAANNILSKGATVHM
jgi:hypothetical protein